MALTPKEEKKLREEIRKRLEAREERYRESKERDEELRRQRLEDRLRARIREEEEEKFYTERGYVQYKNRYGENEWVTPEEQEKRQNSRRVRKTSSRRKRHKRKKFIRWASSAGMLLLALGVWGFLYRYNPSKVKKTGFVWVNAGLPGARIFLDGKELETLTPDTLSRVTAGNHYLAVFKEGFSTWPPYQRISVKPGRTAEAKFQLKSSVVRGQVVVKANISQYRIFVDGIPYVPEGESVLDLTAGMHVITALKSGYRGTPAYQRVLVQENIRKQIKFEFQEEKIYGTLRISSNVEDANIYLNDQFTGLKLRAGAFPVPSGVYEIRIRKPGFLSIPGSKIIRIEPGREKLVVFRMETVQKSQEFRIDSKLPGANILIDGEFTPYMTPMPAIALSNGEHYINLMRNGKLYRPKDRLVNIPQLLDHRLYFDF